ncbi:exocyst complex component EXO70E2-like [Salvia miltiorrhiza]|uniref:exocyst complex component EXO70E2-like n=1 Tax=Salvia miltiorrhiza TaxID=226208 RepID=UPI0025AC9FC6|nr:exocyst complex component EXO70E2-like [Salvia miltiorrhiza]
MLFKNLDLPIFHNKKIQSLLSIQQPKQPHFLHSRTSREPMADITDAERHVVAASYHLVKALQATKILSNDARRLLEDLDVHLSTVIKLNENESKADNIRELETRLVSSHQTIMSLHSSYSKIWASNPVIVLEYLQAVGEVQRLIEILEDMPLNRLRKEVLDQAKTTLQMAMDRLQNELIHTLVQNRQCFEHEYVSSLPVCEVYPIYEESVISNEDDSVEDASLKGRSSSETEECAMDLIHPDVVPQIKSIADTMFASGYAQEFCMAFTAFWKDIFAEYSMILYVEQLSIEDVQQMEWKHLNSRIRKWRVAMRRIIGVYLGSAKRLFDQVLGDYGHISSACLLEASRGPLFCLLNFGNAVSIGPHGPEWLYCLLDMYEVVADLVQDLDALFPQETESLIRIEFHELLSQLRESVRVVLKELGNCIAACPSTTPFQNGGIHPLTKYVVNYILCFAEYEDTVHLLLQDPQHDRERGDEEQSTDVVVDPNPTCALAMYLQSLTSILEATLDKKSSLYRDPSLKHIFLMNNIHYTVEKIKNSKVSHYFGDDWIKKHFVKFRQHAMYYQRTTWSSLLTFLRDDGKVGKATLKARCQDFTAAFEDLYKSQTRWVVPDPQLREDVRISASKTVIQAYRNFVNKIINSIGEKHIKYTEQELGMHIMDLLEGSSKSLNHSRKR